MAVVGVVGAAFLLAVARALARIHVERTILSGHRSCTLSIHCPGRSARAARFSCRLSQFVSERPIWPRRTGRPGDRPVANHPAHRRIAAQPLGVILVAAQLPEHRLAQQPDQSMTPMLASGRRRAPFPPRSILHKRLYFVAIVKIATSFREFGFSGLARFWDVWCRHIGVNRCLTQSGSHRLPFRNLVYETVHDAAFSISHDGSAPAACFGP
jgi:hypothetical protein